MNKIVKSAQKIDLHIHSYYSKHKDGNLVEYNKIDNTNVLIKKIIEKKINIFSITDHDVFSYDLYKNLKIEEEKDNCIKKVLPGIEFSVSFQQSTLKEKTVHVIAIFDDSDEEKLMNISNIISTQTKDGTFIPKYDLNNEFSENKFTEILREINLSVLLIAHQKSSPTGKSITKSDLLTLKERSNELLFTCYFDALEFKNRNNEMFNNSFVTKTELDSKIGFITGTDCHSWENYPFMNAKEEQEYKNDNTDVLFTYAKCLPTFKGLKMCFTDYSRFSYENRFFSTNCALDKLSISLDGANYSIPLSRGINVIIGDNSVGKSLFLYSLLDKEFSSKFNKTKISGYKKYIDKHHIKLSNEIEKNDIFQYDCQGEIRDKFEKNEFKKDKFLSSFFEGDVNTSNHKTILNNELIRLKSIIIESEKNFQRHNSLLKIDFTISEDGKNSLNLTQIKEKRNSKKTIYQNNYEWLDLVLTNLNNRSKIQFETDELEYIDKHIVKYLFNLNKKYKQKYSDEVFFDDVYAKYQTILNDYKSEWARAGTAYQEQLTRIHDELSTVKDSFIELLKYQIQKKDYIPNVPETDIIPNKHINQNYNFVNTCNIDKINSQYFMEVFSKCFKKGKIVNPYETNYNQLNDSVSNIPDDSTGFDYLILKMKKNFDSDLKSKQIINPVDRENDIHKELSAGMNQRSYFHIISGETQNKGIYVVDQPEDGVSQKAINEYVLEDFKKMSRNRQIIFVTHNPQFIVNLDVDNVIFIGKNDENGNLYINSGALEYENDDYSMLSVISDNIEGGIEALRKRWKRYGKEY